MRNYGRLVDGDRLTELARQVADGAEPTDELIDMFYVIADRSHGVRLASFPTTPPELEHEDAVQEAVMACLKAARSYNPSKGRAYNFFRAAIRNRWASIHRWTTRKLRRPAMPMV
ncbi:MAG: sigma factor, partial [Planctomycetota bacterium]